MPEYTYTALVSVRAANEEEAEERLDEAQGMLARTTTARLYGVVLVGEEEERGTPEGRTDA